MAKGLKQLLSEMLSKLHIRSAHAQPCLGNEGKPMMGNSDWKSAMISRSETCHVQHSTVIDGLGASIFDSTLQPGN